MALSVCVLVTWAEVDSVSADVIIDWNQQLIQAIRDDPKPPTEASRDMAMVQAAMYDAVSAVDRTYQPYAPLLPARPNTSEPAAAAVAGHDVLVNLFPSQQPRFDNALNASLVAVSDGSSKAAGISLGHAAANQMIDLRSHDGSTTVVPYTPGTSPGQWRPTPPDYSPAVSPGWGQVTPFALSSDSQFRPPPPPSLNSPEYAAILNEVRTLGAVNSSVRTPDQTRAGMFWGYDRAGVGPPNILYNQIAQTIAVMQGNTLEQNARLFALLNIAQADAAIAAWDAKYTYNFWRPITAIQQIDPTWQPLGAPGGGARPNFTPAFPAYISGHSTFGAAVFTILADFYGTDAIKFTIGSDELPGVFRTYNSFSQAAAENGMSRIYLGIHWQFDNTFGLATGSQIGDLVFNTRLRPEHMARHHINPEPSTWILFGSGIAVLLWRSAKRRGQKVEID
jgi:hypothetical protein